MPYSSLPHYHQHRRCRLPLLICVRQFLKSCITLMEDSADLFLQSPLPAFDQYLNQLRAGTVRQTASQCNDDAVSVDTQTEVGTCAVASMQFPDDIGVGGNASSKGVVYGLWMDTLRDNHARMQPFRHRASAILQLQLYWLRALLV